MDYFLQRRNTLSKSLKKEDLDALLVTNPTNVRYLSGFTGDSSYLLHGEKKTWILSDSRFELQIAEETKELQVVIRPHTQKLPDAAAQLVTQSGLKKIGFESNHVSVALKEQLDAQIHKKTSLLPTQGLVERQRMYKDPSEVEQIRLAIRHAERAFRLLMFSLQDTLTEKDMADMLEASMRRSGAKGSSFTPIIAVGERSALPHAVPSMRLANEGTKILFDWGADVGYKSDLTRTCKNPLSTMLNRRSKVERAGYEFDVIYEAVKNAHEAAVAALRHGVKAKNVDAAARQVLAQTKLGGNAGINLEACFTHGLGHGIGLEIHEGPSIRSNSEDVLETGMVVTIEPGVYIPEWGGIRLEDDYLILKDGAVRLTTLPQHPNLIEY